MKPDKKGKPPSPFLFALYRSSLRLYPRRLHLLYQDQLLQTARDAMPIQPPASTSGPPSSLTFSNPPPRSICS